MRAVLNLPMLDVMLHVAAMFNAFYDWQDRMIGLVIGEYCDMCDDVHGEGDRCNRVLIRWCMDCTAWISANKWMRCPIDERHQVHAGMRKAVRSFQWNERVPLRRVQ